LDEVQLFDAAVGALAPDGAEARHLDGCALCANGARMIAEGLVAAATRIAPAVAPPPSLRARLLGTIAEDLPFAAHQAALERLFDLDAEGVRAILRRSRQALEWEPGFVPGMWLFHLEAGPRWKEVAAGRRLDAGLVRFEPHARFGGHAHPGEEHSLILSGSLRLTDGRVYGPGDTAFESNGSVHGFTAGPDGCVFAVVLVDGLKFVDEQCNRG
jgi:quercetin dioxygenase-like cupin family protein